MPSVTDILIKSIKDAIEEILQTTNNNNREQLEGIIWSTINNKINKSINSTYSNLFLNADLQINKTLKLKIKKVKNYV